MQRPNTPRWLKRFYRRARRRIINRNAELVRAAESIGGVQQASLSRTPVSFSFVKIEPTPLICPPKEIGLIWSPKSACTASVLWFFSISGLLERALAYDVWPHNYRMRAMSFEDPYRAWLQNGDLEGLRWIRVVRDPYKRAITSYRQALTAPLERQGIERTLGIDVESRGFSFVEFLEFLGDAGADKVDLHLGLQKHPIESRVTLTRTINADKEPLIESLCAFSDPGPETKAKLLEAVDRIASYHYARRVTANEDQSNVIFTPEAARGAWPDYPAFLNRETRGKIEQVFSEDFEAYGPYL